MLYIILDSIRSKENKKTRYVLILVVLLLCSATAYFVNSFYKRDNALLPPLTEEEQELVGEWKFTSTGSQLQFNYGYVLLSDHKCIGRYYSDGTTCVLFQSEDYLWWREGGQLTVRAKNASFREVIAIGSMKLRRAIDSDSIYVLTPDGLGGFSTKASTRNCQDRDIPQSRVSGKLLRVDRTRD